MHAYLVAADHPRWDPRLLQRDLNVSRQRAIPKQDRHVAVVDEAARVRDNVLDLARDKVGLVRRVLRLVQHD